jgi:uncharacterized protein YbjT (DUF2867 family)
LLDHTKADTFNITTLVRSEEKAAKLRTLGIQTVIGSLSEFEKLEKLASEADIVFSIVRIDAYRSIDPRTNGTHLPRRLMLMTCRLLKPFWPA